MASGPITSWQIGGEKVETVTYFWGGLQVTTNGDFSHKIRRCLLLERKAMTNLDSILKSRDITLPTKVHLVKAMIFPVVMYECELVHKEGWALKKWCFWICAVEDSWQSLGQQGYQTSQSWRKSTLNIHWKDWCWSWISNTLVTWWEEPTYWKRLWCWEGLRARGKVGDRGWDGWMASLTWWTWVWANCRR